MLINEFNGSSPVKKFLSLDTGVLFGTFSDELPIHVCMHHVQLLLCDKTSSSHMKP